MLGSRPDSRGRGGPPAASVRGYRARRAARQARILARNRLRAVAAVDKTSCGARRTDGTRVNLLGVAEHGGHLLDHLEVGVKHNETSHFTELLEPIDLAGAVVTWAATRAPDRLPGARSRGRYAPSQGRATETRYVSGRSQWPRGALVTQLVIIIDPDGG